MPRTRIERNAQALSNNRDSIPGNDACMEEDHEDAERFHGEVSVAGKNAGSFLFFVAEDLIVWPFNLLAGIVAGED